MKNRRTDSAARFDTQDVYQFLVERLEKKGISQREFASRIGDSHSLMYRLKKGERRVTLPMTNRIIEFLGLSGKEESRFIDLAIKASQRINNEDFSDEKNEALSRRSRELQVEQDIGALVFDDLRCEFDVEVAFMRTQPMQGCKQSKSLVVASGNHRYVLEWKWKESVYQS